MNIVLLLPFSLTKKKLPKHVLLLPPLLSFFLLFQIRSQPLKVECTQFFVINFVSLPFSPPPPPPPLSPPFADSFFKVSFFTEEVNTATV